MKRIFLIGYMGVGKTTAGKELARMLSLEFVDLDLFIQTRYHKTVSQLFEENGEEEFRKIENKLLKEVADFENVVVSTGGGAPCFFDNIEWMNNKGITIYLKASPEALSKRLNTCKDKRPLIRDKSEDELYDFVRQSLDKREPYYSKAKYTYQTEELINKSDLTEYVSEMVRILNLKEAQ